ncbi:hypothetical protein APUTEX25_002807, partial [Auxenochlorella protothecoides]
APLRGSVFDDWQGQHICSWPGVVCDAGGRAPGPASAPPPPPWVPTDVVGWATWAWFTTNASWGSYNDAVLDTYRAALAPTVSLIPGQINFTLIQAVTSRVTVTGGGSEAAILRGGVQVAVALTMGLPAEDIDISTMASGTSAAPQTPPPRGAGRRLVGAATEAPAAAPAPAASPPTSTTQTFSVLARFPSEAAAEAGTAKLADFRLLQTALMTTLAGAPGFSPAKVSVASAAAPAPSPLTLSNATLTTADAAAGVYAALQTAITAANIRAGLVAAGAPQGIVVTMASRLAYTPASVAPPLAPSPPPPPAVAGSGTPAWAWAVLGAGLGALLLGGLLALWLLRRRRRRRSAAALAAQESAAGDRSSAKDHPPSASVNGGLTPKTIPQLSPRTTTRGSEEWGPVSLISTISPTAASSLGAGSLAVVSLGTGPHGIGSAGVESLAAGCLDAASLGARSPAAPSREASQTERRTSEYERTLPAGLDPGEADSDSDDDIEGPPGSPPAAAEVPLAGLPVVRVLRAERPWSGGGEASFLTRILADRTEHLSVGRTFLGRWLVTPGSSVTETCLTRFGEDCETGEPVAFKFFARDGDEEDLPPLVVTPRPDFTLAGLLAACPRPPPAQCLVLVSDAAGALAHLHARGG